MAGTLTVIVFTDPMSSSLREAVFGALLAAALWVDGGVAVRFYRFGHSNRTPDSSVAERE